MIAESPEIEGKSAGRARRAVLHAAEWLCLAATPTFAVLAILTSMQDWGRYDCALLRRAGWIDVEWNGADVRADERLPCATLAEVNVQSTEPHVLALVNSIQCRKAGCHELQVMAVRVRPSNC